MKTPWLQLWRGWRVRLEVKPADCWVGWFWSGSVLGRDRSRPLLAHFDLWICVLPCLPFHFANDFSDRK